MKKNKMIKTKKENNNIISERNGNIIKEIENMILKDGRFVKSDKEEKIIDKLAFRNAIINLDEIIIDKLFKIKTIKNEYFKKIKDIYVFDKTKFMYLFDNESFLGDSYTRFKDSIGLIDKNEKFIIDNDDVVLSFPFKDCLLEFDSTDVNDKRDEYFINENIAKNKVDVMLEPKVFVNCKKYDKNGEKNINKFDINDNLLIKGNNLLVMHSLLPVYEGEIKLMYWDILYNTGDDLVPYADSFKHSSWLVMMKNRLEIAKKLLKDDGVICLQCDDNEMAYLKVLIDEVFGRENFIDIVINQSANSVFGKRAKNKNKTIVKIKDYILIYYNKKFNGLIPLYTKSERPIYDSHEFFLIDNKKISITDWFKKNCDDYFDKYKFKITKENIIKLLVLEKGLYATLLPKIENILFEAVACDKKLPDVIEKKLIGGEIVEYNEIKYCREDNGKGKLRFLRSLKESCNITDDYISEYTKTDIMGDIWNTSSAYQNINVEGGVVLSGGKKPEFLIKNLLKMFTAKNDLILDAYFGTGTTGAVAMKMGRKFIGIEQLDEHVKSLAIPRLKNVIYGDETGISKLPDVNWKGGGSFVSVELANLNNEYIEKIQKVKKESENKLNDLYNEIVSNAYLNCYLNANSLLKQKAEFIKLNFADKKKLLIELLDKNNLYVNFVDMDDKEFKIKSKNDKEWTKSFYKAGK